jgi:sporulation protein YlmC with PRC-barrel domain
LRNIGIVEETKTETHMNFRPVSGIKGSNVVNVKEEKLGKIEDAMLDVITGRIAYVVISFGSWLSTNKKLFAVPWDSLKYNRGDYLLKVDKAVFEKAEGLDEDAWTLDYDKLKEVYKRCGIQPYWK